MQMLLDILDQIRVVTGQMSPYLLFGFLAAGCLHVLVPASWMQRHLGGRGIVPVIKSVLFGVPLPLCSCGVIAVTASIRKQGAGRGAAVGFLIATPQTGVDSIFATWGMLGPVLGIFRPFMALITGIIGGGLVALFDTEDQPGPGAASSAGVGNRPLELDTPKRSVGEVLHYGLVTLPRDIAKPLIVGVILAGMVAALIPQGVLAPYIGGGLVAMLVMSVVGIPLYVCATASIPVALGFIHLGASPGAALVFLITGPATNAATIATVWKVMGQRAAAIYLATVTIGGIIAGLLFDAVTNQAWINDISMLHHEHVHHGEGAGALNAFWAAVLVLVVLNSLYGESIKRYLKRAGSAPGSGAEVEMSISGMTCTHCADAIARKLKDLGGVRDVSIDVAAGRATIFGDNVNPHEIQAAIEELGYKAAHIN